MLKGHYIIYGFTKKSSFGIRQDVRYGVPVCKWEKRSPFSGIEASIMIPPQSLVDSEQNTYIFFKNTNSGTLKLSDCIVETAKSQKPVSLISDNRDYARGQVRPPTLLYKEKREISTGIITVLFDKLSLQQTGQNEQSDTEKTMEMSTL